MNASPSLKRFSVLLLAAVLLGTTFSLNAQSYIDANISTQIDLNNTPYVPPSNEMNPPYDADEWYRACVQAAVYRRESATISLYNEYYQRRMQLRVRLGQERVQVWAIYDSRDRRDEDRRVERQYKDDLREVERWYDDVDDEIGDRYRDESRNCDRERRELERRQRDWEKGNRTSRSSSSRMSSSRSSSAYSQWNWQSSSMYSEWNWQSSSRSSAYSQWNWHSSRMSDWNGYSSPRSSAQSQWSWAYSSGGPVPAPCDCRSVCTDPTQPCILICRYDCSR